MGTAPYRMVTRITCSAGSPALRAQVDLVNGLLSAGAVLRFSQARPGSRARATAVARTLGGWRGPA